MTQGCQELRPRNAYFKKVHPHLYLMMSSLQNFSVCLYQLSLTAAGRNKALMFSTMFLEGEKGHILDPKYLQTSIG